MGVRDITQKEFFTDDKRFADLINAVCFHGCPILKPEELISVPESVRKADEAAVLERTYDVVKKQALDGESKFFLATMLDRKRLKNKLLKKTEKEEDVNMCKAIDDMIKEGEEKGRAEGRAEAERIITELNGKNAELMEEIKKLRLQLAMQS